MCMHIFAYIMCLFLCVHYVFSVYVPLWGGGERSLAQSVVEWVSFAYRCCLVSVLENITHH